MRTARWSIGWLALVAAAPALSAGLAAAAQAPHRLNAEARPITTSVRSLYVVHCAGCHGMDASGSPSANVPDMRRLGNFLLLDGGREFVIKVPGVMGSGLTDQQIADVTNWLLATLAKDSLPAGHVVYDVAEVQRARAVPLVDVAGARKRLASQARERGIVID